MIRSFDGLHPQIAATAFADETAQIIGNVVIGEHASIWMYSVIRGDLFPIRIGDYTNIQDNCVLHVEEDLYSLTLEDHITVGHGVLLHGCYIERRCLIGMGSILLNDCRIGEGSIIAAGTIVMEHAVIPPRSMVMGIPGTVRRAMTDTDLERIDNGAEAYYQLKERYLTERRIARQAALRQAVGRPSGQ
ncbi:MAG: gamma carbonic anhydrase family protein [Acidobacteria bacterium]|nr:gamma carbonic anhydrase family protein [Acidobacteriota bacterium]